MDRGRRDTEPQTWTKESQNGGERRERERARKIRARKPERGRRESDESVCRHRERPREARSSRKKDKEIPSHRKAGSGSGRSGEAEGPRDSPRVSAGGKGERQSRTAAGGGRTSVLLLILCGFPLSESAFGDTGTKAVHHITARPGGSLRSRRLIRGERIGRAGREGGRPPGGGPGPRARTRGAGNGPACAPGSVGTRSEGGGTLI